MAVIGKRRRSRPICVPSRRRSGDQPGYTVPRELSNRKRKTVEGTQVPETALPENKRWKANGEHGRWSLVT